MDGNHQMEMEEVHYMTTGFPYNSTESFMDFFGGLSQVPLPYAHPPPMPQDQVIFFNYFCDF